MTALPPYLSAKNTLVQKGYKMCVEFLIQNTGAPSTWLYYRKATYDQDIVATIDQLGNAGATINATFTGGSPIGDVNIEISVQNDTPSAQIVLPNAARELESIAEFYDLSQMPGRLLWIHPDHPSDGPAIEFTFQIQAEDSVGEHATLTVSPYSFDRNTTMLPRTQVSIKTWPGLAGARRRFIT